MPEMNEKHSSTKKSSQVKIYEEFEEQSDFYARFVYCDFSPEKSSLGLQ
jgi:hypothetical protein